MAIDMEETKIRAKQSAKEIRKISKEGR